MGLHKHLHSASFYIGVFPVLYLLYSTALSRFLLVIGWVGGFKGYGVFYKCIAPFRCNRSASFPSICFFLSHILSTSILSFFKTKRPLFTKPFRFFNALVDC